MKHRDVTFIPLNNNYLVIACDNSCSIGEKENDLLSVSTETVAALCLRTPLLELVCVGAEPLIVIDTLGNEMDPTGKKVIRGLKREIAKSPYFNLLLNGSTEENMLSFSTNIGITVIGMIDKVPVSKVETLTKIWLLGELLVGEEVIGNIDKLVDYYTIEQIKNISGVIDIIPIGSKGINWEANIMANSSKLIPKFNDKSIDITKSSGPSTAMLIAADPDIDLSHLYHNLRPIGEFVEKGAQNV